MGILSTLKSILGLGSAERRDQGTAVTVEREREHEREEPDAESERAVKEAEAETGEGESVDEIKGIGPAYAERLSEAGVETVADLAAADAADLAAETDISETRIGNWIERARAR